ncbi:ATP-grasp domain-containing protein [Algoriphagus chordae]|uniref:RimK-like ATP-grasp domain-containing protein n=1 Tax=Algoriphagus chordae TaxID=237019 RepID=A0A2W7R916_9BACT|nr:ATP-grasp domain-containing protein [Algoriphagus chordae]PZX55596.1 RimK-like ATP-grasp domain-containing protein [Algoriphagus chordae]
MQLVAKDNLEIPELNSTDWERMPDPTRMTNSFEFGPSWWFHLPMALIGISWAIRLWKANYFAAANPALENGGLYNYSKYAAQNHFPQANLPATCLIHSEEDIEMIMEKISAQNLQFPFIIKPDVGERGKGVKLIHQQEDLEIYLKEQPVEAYLIQGFVAKSQEYGVFFFKNPATGELEIPSLTRKIPLQILGDGISKLSELIQNHPRASRYQNLIEVSDPSFVPLQGELIKLSPMGNHCKGAVFLDYSAYINADMIAALRRIFESVEGINYGRLDVKVDHLSDLSEPDRISILEVNGANAEPAHLYSPEKNYHDGLKTINSYFHTMAMIAKQNLQDSRNRYRESDTWASLMQYLKK